MSDASTALSKALHALVNHEDIAQIRATQDAMDSRLGGVNAALESLNNSSAHALALATHQFTQYTGMLVEARKDLHIIFRRIRIIKEKLAKQYPAAMQAAVLVVEASVDANALARAALEDEHYIAQAASTENEPQTLETTTHPETAAQNDIPASATPVVLDAGAAMDYAVAPATAADALSMTSEPTSSSSIEPRIAKPSEDLSTTNLEGASDIPEALSRMSDSFQGEEPEDD